jgi:hypothetical protein
VYSVLKSVLFRPLEVGRHRFSCFRHPYRGFVT